MDEDQQMLQDALMMSIGGGAEAAGAPAGGQDADLGAMTEEEQIAYAIQMSMAESADPTPAAQPMEDDSSQLVTDPEFLQTVLQNLPGVDPNSDAVKEALGESKKEDAKKKDED